MRKIVVLVLVGAVALTPLTAEAGKKKKKNTAHQEETGSIMLPAPADPVDTVCNSGAHRRTNVYTQGNAQGIVGYHFDVDPETVGLPFVLEVTGGSGDVDLDISFYQSMGDPADPAGAPGNISFEDRAAGGEFGDVPEGFPLAIVCAYAGQNVEFSYEAKSGLKPPS